MRSDTLYGLILKGIGGFYCVKTADGVLECKAKGVFRNEGVSPCAGDTVQVRLGSTNVIEAITPRANLFSRPRIANVTRVYIVVSSVEPAPNLLNIDKMCAIASSKNVEPLIVLTKTDKERCRSLKRVYKQAGIRVFDCSFGSRLSLVRLRSSLRDGVNVFIGNSGVGKSSLLNRLVPSLCLQTDEISAALGRGKHTTRAVELFPYRHGYIADTPGFSTIDIEKAEPISIELLPHCFTEFERYLGGCRFTDCSHTCEEGCAILAAVDRGDISKQRFDSYVRLYEAARSIKNKR